MSEENMKIGCREEHERRMNMEAERRRRRCAAELGEEDEDKNLIRRIKRQFAMAKSQKPSQWYQLRERELWSRFEHYRPYPSYPSLVEFDLIEDFLYPFYWEDDDVDFDESSSSKSNPDWISIKDRLQSPNLRLQLIKFLDQVRHSKGYDVDLDFFSEDDPVKAALYSVLFDHPSTEYVPRDLKLKKFSDLANWAAKIAIGEINDVGMNKAEAIRGNGGKRCFELLSVDKLVTAVNHLEIDISEWLFLTLTATEKKIIGETVTTRTVTMQALVVVLDQPSPNTFRLYEWKFKRSPLSLGEASA